MYVTDKDKTIAWKIDVRLIIQKYDIDFLINAEINRYYIIIYKFILKNLSSLNDISLPHKKRLILIIEN